MKGGKATPSGTFICEATKHLSSTFYFEAIRTFDAIFLIPS